MSKSDFCNNWLQQPSCGYSFAPQWNNWNSMPNWNTWNMPAWGESAFNQLPMSTTVPSASSVSTANLSPDEIERLQRKERAESSKEVQACVEQKVEAQKTLESLEAEYKKVNSKIDENGIATVAMSAEEYEKKVPWWKRACRAVGNAVQGTFKMAKSLVGFDENGKWDPIKCVKNVGIMVAGVALTAVCPAAGPVLLYAGLALGAAQIGKGVYKACTAKTVDEIDNAWQDVGVGVATAVASRGGLKGMGKTANVEMSGLKIFTNAKQLVSAQPENIFAAGFKGSGTRFLLNIKNMNPLKTESEKKLQNAKNEYAEINQKLNDTSLSSTEADTLLNRGIQLESEMSNLEATRMNELVMSPSKWLSKQNRIDIKNHTGKGVLKSYWEANTANKGLWGKSWFTTKKLGGTALQVTMPEFMVWNPLKHSAFTTSFKGTDNFLYAQNYTEEGLLNSYMAPEAVAKLSPEELSKYTAQYTAQKGQCNALIADADTKLNRHRT